MDDSLAGREYAAHLSDADLALLASVAARLRAAAGRTAPRPRRQASSLRADPAATAAAAGTSRPVPGGARPGPGRPRMGGSGISLSWCSRCWCSGPPASWPRWTTCRSAPGRVSGCRCSMRLRCGSSSGAPARRLFLAELLASFTRVASGRYRVTAGGRTRTRRFSELDPVRLAGLLEEVPEAERPGIYRRLGDVTLFLTGVFPGYAADRALGPVERCPAAARGRPARRRARPAGRPAGHRAVGVPRRLLVPNRP